MGWALLTDILFWFIGENPSDLVLNKNITSLRLTEYKKPIHFDENNDERQNYEENSHNESKKYITLQNIL